MGIFQRDDGKFDVIVSFFKDDVEYLIGNEKEYDISYNYAN